MDYIVEIGDLNFANSADSTYLGAHLWIIVSKRPCRNGDESFLQNFIIVLITQMLLLIILMRLSWGGIGYDRG